MQDTALYQYLLGLKSPWTVSRVELNVKRQCVEVWAEHPEGTIHDPRCYTNHESPITGYESRPLEQTACDPWH